MIRAIRILEVPLLTLTIAVGMYEKGSMVLGTSLAIISVIRLVVNVYTDEFNYKR
jgi:hypothetical protein